MKLLAAILLILTSASACSRPTSHKHPQYVGSTPVDRVVRDFLDITTKDSLDFIRWNLVIRADSYDLDCQYGQSKGGTPGFIHEYKAGFSGSLRKEGNYYYLDYQGRTCALAIINENLLQLLDENKNILAGNGGYSYTLSIDQPTKSDQFNLPTSHDPLPPVLVFEGRTRCAELSKAVGMGHTSECVKLKWYFIFYTDSTTGQPTYFLEGGRGYRRETMEKGKWEIAHGKDRRIIYKLKLQNKPWSLYLLKGAENIWFFVDPEGNLLVGDEDFAYTLNRRKEEHPPL